MALPPTADSSTIASALSDPDVLRSALEAALGLSRDALMIIDAHGAVVAVNEAFPEVWGIGPSAASRGADGALDDEALLGAALARAVDRGAVLARIHGGESADGMITLIDGRVLACRAASLADDRGRAVSFHEVDARGPSDLAVDPPTGAVPADLFPRAGSAVLRRARDGGNALSVALIDIINLVPIGRANGSEVHDELLSACAHRWNGITRAHDLVGRVGEQRFAVLMDGARPKMARVLADRLCEATREVSLDRGLIRLRPKLMIGVACLRPGDDLEALLRRAEQSLAAAPGEFTIGPLETDDDPGSSPTG